MATPEQMQQMYNDFDAEFQDTIRNLEAKVAQLRGGGSGGISGNCGEVTNKFKYKSFTRMDKFTGNADEWSGWVFNLKVCADAMDDGFGEAVHEVTKAKLDKENVESLKEIVGRTAIETEPYKLSKKFFEVLCGLTTGEANVVVRGTAEKFGNCGLGALYLLNKRYRPNTHARKTQCLTEVVRPQIIKDSRQLATAVEIWEGKVEATPRFQPRPRRWNQDCHFYIYDSSRISRYDFSIGNWAGRRRLQRDQR